MSRRRSFALFGVVAVAAALLASLDASASHASAHAATGRSAHAAPPTYTVDAIRYGTIPGFPLYGLVAGVDTTKKIDIAMMVWLVRGGGRTVLVDAGFYRDDLVKRWKAQDFSSPAEAIRRAGVSPEQVTDVILTHGHWDHAGGADLFPRAKVWLQREEFEFYADSEKARRAGLDFIDSRKLRAIDAAGRIGLANGDAQEIIPGITVYTGGKHTVASQYVGVHTKAGTVVLASDNAYLYYNLEHHRPIAQTLDSVSNLAAQARMHTIASSDRLIVPGHDPEVFVRFPRPGNGVAHIE